MYYLALHIKPFSSKRNKTGIILTYYGEHDSGALFRPLKHRGIRFTFVAVRLCTEDEFKTESNPWRYSFIHYDDWGVLIEDERIYSQDPIWFAQLQQLKKEWPHFKRDQPITRADKKTVPIHWVPIESRIADIPKTPAFFKPGHKVKSPRQISSQLQLIFE